MTKKKHPISCTMGIPLAGIKLKDQDVIAHKIESGIWTVFKEGVSIGTVQEENGEWIALGVTFQRVRDAVSYIALS